MTRERYKPLYPSANTASADVWRIMRLNSLGSLFFFIHTTMKRDKLTESLHLPFCYTLERDHIKDVIEMPRGHFKSTICSEGLPMWRVLPCGQQDVDDFLKLGYSDEFIRWMIRVHNPDARNLLVSENITNAAALGRKIRWHYESNDYYIACFPETLPDSSCSWTDYSLSIKRPNGGHGEGTFDFRGVGSALQSRHYNGLLVEDDTVGRKAVESQSVMDKTIEYHQILPGVFENDDKNHENDELSVGNRWSFHDKNSYMREHEPWFRFESHSAFGGCCPLHPSDTIIFPEQFSFEKLMRLKRRYGNYQFSCQYLNNPVAPEDADFKVEWLNYFRLEYDAQDQWQIVHETKNGEVRKNLKAHRLSIGMTSDPNHSGNTGMGRCRHANVVLAQSEDGNYYLLDAWAQAASYDTYYDKLFEMAQKWHLSRIGVETIAAQKYIKHHIEYLARVKNYSIRIDELKGEVEAADGTMSRKKEWRIRNILAPIAEQGRLFVQREHQDFIGEYQTFPKGKFCDLLDAFAYAPQLLRQPMDFAMHLELLTANQEQMSRVGQPYSYGTSRFNA